MSFIFTNLIAAFLLPPLSFLLLLALGIILMYRRHKFAMPLLLGAFVMIWLSSMPYVADGALHMLETRTAALQIPQAQAADAIVILGGGTYFDAPEYASQDTVSEPTLVRLRYGAKLRRETGRPLLVTGGTPMGNGTSEAQLMRVALEQDFGASVRWMEEASNNTFENALYSFQILQKVGIKKICLVTHAWHMPRSAAIFRQAGFEVVEAPTAFTTRHRFGMLEFMPDSEALQESRIFVHEVIGLLWYRIRWATFN